ncbi:hypothetical protein ACDH60_04155 [Pseudomonas ficuserectae]|uniref:Site-specific integrase n=1 Tax=Pseudomonas amygdali pv. lachrymans TaxID=53707 RepID=A0AB37RAM7_PSEAV|nr:hypothetical protein [Pseudomonas amygdali]KPC02332.1 Uncharacterized protein AC501_3618 [Pseudomonas amygdali pv. lachrymans]PWD01885.1 hypothetical protein CX658_18130 [Pseudomonas amygdali pv. lachrymans]RMP19757.1 hypothetical protein ALQ26_02395 [Pseudomonas amygdali pv. lachrymans]RMU22819.1 hypothetical protein ALP33_00308 [Pseudomonas amygdali pv. lachrymans]WIO58879.1 hypothetical protein QO021_03465 [Pseudomonas amygdali pv. lachrymans]
MNSQEKMVFRDTNVITRDQISREFLRPELLRLQLGDARVKKSPIDIGSLAYFKRAVASRANADKGIPVAELSLVESRRKLIINLLDWFQGFRDTTVLLRWRLLEGVVAWLNENGYVDIFSDAIQASKAYIAYTDFLNHLLMGGKFSPRHANALQKTFQQVIKLQLPGDFKYIIRGAVVVSPTRNNIRPPRQSDVQMFKDVCLAVSRCYSEFVLNQEPYPCVVKIRDYEVVKFPSKSGAVGPVSECPPCYNVEHRRISTLDEYVSRLEKKGRKVIVGNIKFDLNKIQDNFVAANTDGRHYDRILMAALAAKAYAALFLLITGASPTELEQFEYEDALEVEQSSLKKELSAIKFRAGGKETGYVIGRKEGLPLLREYLKLREWILDGQLFDKLFFTISSKGGEFGRVFSKLHAPDSMQTFYNSISGVFLDQKYPNITSRKIRKHKSNVQHAARFAPDTVAKSLNHTRAVNFLAYAEATLEQQESEFGAYWESVRHAAQKVRKRSESPSETTISIATGHCEAFNSPTPILYSNSVVIEPNCRTQYGCLYCTYYVCHSDEEDVHKLLSLRYVINAVRNTAGDISHAETLFKDLSIRIEFILDAISDRSEVVAQMVARMKNKVYELGVLTQFWEKRLQRYEQMGVVF